MNNKLSNNKGVKILIGVSKQWIIFHRWLYIIVFLAVFNTGFSQVISDSLKLVNIENALFMFNSNDTLTGKNFCNNLEIIAHTATDSLLKSEADYLAGVIHGRMGNFDDALRLLDKALKSTNRINTRRSALIRAKALSGKGALLYQNGDFKEALDCYLEAEKLYFINNNKEGLISVYAGMANLYDKILQPEKREEINEKAFILAEFTTDTIAKIKAYTGKATNLSNENKFQEAIALYQKTLDMAQKIGNKNLEHVAYYDLGFTYSRMEDFPKSIEMYRKSLEAAEKAGNLNDTGDALYKLGLMYYYSENLESSRDELAKAMKIADRVNSNILRRNIYDVLYSVEETAGNYKKAYEYLNKYVDVEFEIFSQEDQQQVNFLKAKFDAEKREFQIAKLEAEKEIQSLKLYKQRWFILALVMVLLLVTLFTLFLVRQNRYRHDLAEKQRMIQEQKIQEMEKERQLIATKSVLQGEEKERTRIASDLHDGLGGLLSGVKINLSNMKESAYLSDDQVTSFNNVISLLDTSIKELRRIAHNMAPETLYKYGLKIALSDYCIGISSSGSPEISFNFFGEDHRLTPELELSFYRIGQELINNSIKHSGASQINVQLFSEENRVALQVFDNGSGFDTSAENNSKGNGLSNIKNRVAAFGGKFELYSRKDEGTEVLVELEF